MFAKNQALEINQAKTRMHAPRSDTSTTGSCSKSDIGSLTYCCPTLLQDSGVPSGEETGTSCR